jgi:hypothetical protein
MRCPHNLPDSQISEMLDTLSVQQEEAQAALAKATSLNSQWSFAAYLDTAALFPEEARTALYKSVVTAAAAFIEMNLHDTPELEELAEQSWAYGDLVNAELERDELELTLDYEAIPVEAVEVISRAAARPQLALSE